MENVYVRSAEIVRRMKLEMPVHITLNDPITGDPITLSRENILELLVVESHNLILEGQTVAALYAEMGRFRAAASMAHAKAEAAFRKWKARMGHELREVQPEKKTAAGKRSAKQGPTGDEVTAYYRMHGDYDKFHDEVARMSAIVDILTDLRRAFDIKDNVVTDQLRTMRGHESVLRGAETTDRFEAYASVSVGAQIAAAGGVPDEIQQSMAAFKEELSGNSESDSTTRTARSLD